MEDNRIVAVKVLGSILGRPKNVEILEKALYNASPMDENGDIIVSEYMEYLYQIVSDIQAGKKLSDILADVKNHRLGWNHYTFEENASIIKEQDDYLEHPFSVEEGVLECKCGSRKVYSYQVQSRSCDEGMSTYARCVKCRAQWVHVG